MSVRGVVRRTALAGTLALTVIACSAVQPQPPPPPPARPPLTKAPAAAPSIVGVASWYGPGFNGHRTSTGNVYDQEDLTAASILFPLGSHVMVTNLDNGRSVEVVVKDHGPFLKSRTIDLSHKAADAIGMVRKGTAHVRVDLISAPRGSRPVGSQIQYFVQLGSFEHRGNAEQMRVQAAARYPDVRIDYLDAGERRYYRVRMGAFATRAEAEARAAASVRSLGIPAVIVAE
jgi:peptidoglycan lytic transglycosylase